MTIKNKRKRKSKQDQLFKKEFEDIWKRAFDSFTWTSNNPIKYLTDSTKVENYKLYEWKIGE